MFTEHCIYLLICQIKSRGLCMSVMADLMCTGNMAAKLSQLINKLMTQLNVLRVVHLKLYQPQHIFYVCLFFFASEKKLNSFIVFTRYIIQSSFLRVAGVISCYIICCVSLHYFVGDRNSVGSVGSSRSTGSGQSSESTHNKQNESHLRTDMCKVLVYAI